MAGSGSNKNANGSLVGTSPTGELLSNWEGPDNKVARRAAPVWAMAGMPW